MSYNEHSGKEKIAGCPNPNDTEVMTLEELRNLPKHCVYEFNETTIRNLRTNSHDQSNSDVVDEENQMYQVEKIQIPFSEKLSEICQFSKKLRNKAVFIGRQVRFLLFGTEESRHYALAQQYPDLAQKIFEFMKDKLDSPQLIDELHDKLFSDFTLNISEEIKKQLNTFCCSNANTTYNTLYNFLKFTPEYLNLKKYYSVLPQQVLKYVADSWKTYFNGKKSWKKYPEKFLSEPKYPSTRRGYKEFLISFPSMYFNNIKQSKLTLEHYYNTKRTIKVTNKRTGKVIKRTTTGELRFPRKFLRNFPINALFPIIRTKIDIKLIQEVRIVPKKCCYEVQIVYPRQIIKDKNLLNENAGAIDIGLNVLVAMVTNLGTQPILIRGKNIKSINQYMNKKVGQLRKIQLKGKRLEKGEIIPETMEMFRIRRRRNNVVYDYFHKVSCYIISHCLEHKIGRLVIGYNSGWKREINLGKKNNQNFAYVPFKKLIGMIQYKAKLVGINIELINESHTSKCSALDFETIEHHDQYMGGRKPSTKGRKKKREGIGDKTYYPRGLFRSANGLIIHSDVNGAFNIGRRAFPDAFNRNTLSIRDMLKNPITAKIC